MTTPRHTTGSSRVHDFTRQPALLRVEVNHAALVLQAQGGDMDAYSTLVELNWVRLVRFARSVTGDADAEDVVQDSLVTAWEKLGALKSPEAFPSWVLRIVARVAFRHARRRFRFTPLAAAENLSDPGSDRDRESIDVEHVLSLLPPRQRAVMHLTVIEGMSDSEIGASLGIAAASVRSHRRRARETLLPALRRMELQGGTES